MPRHSFAPRADGARRFCAALALLAVCTGGTVALQPASAHARDLVLAQAQPAAEGEVKRGPVEPLEIATAKGVLLLEVEVARTDEQRATGLMYRREVPEHTGMLFDFKVDQPVYMWMKNTFVPLDMLFIRADGTVARIAAMTTPYSTQTISSGEPVRAVLEIAGGAAARLGIAPGDKVAHPVFK